MDETSSPTIKRRFDWEQFALISLVVLCVSTALILGGYLFAKSHIERRLAQELVKFEKSVAAKGSLTHSRVRVDLFHLGIRIDNLSFTPTASKISLHFNQAIISHVDFSTLQQIYQTHHMTIPRHVRIGVYGVSIENSDESTSGAAGAIARLANELGYPEVHLDLVGDIDYDSKRQKLGVTELQISARDMGDTTLSIDVENLALPTREDIAAIKEDAHQIQNVFDRLSGIRLNSFELQYEDHSLAKRVIKYLEKDGESMVGLLDLTLGILHEPHRQTANVSLGESHRPDEDSAYAIGILSQVRTFVSDPKIIVISAKPEHGLTLKEMTLDPARGQLSALARKLRFSVEASH